MRIDIKTRRPIFKNNVGGMSGPIRVPDRCTDGLAGRQCGEDTGRRDGRRHHMERRGGNDDGRRGCCSDGRGDFP